MTGIQLLSGVRCKVCGVAEARVAVVHGKCGGPHCSGAFAVAILARGKILLPKLRRLAYSEASFKTKLHAMDTSIL